MIFLKTLGIAGLVYAAYGVTLFTMQRSMMFPRRYAQPPMHEVRAAGMKRVWLIGGKGKVEAWYIPAKGPAEDEKRPAVLFFHGNAELIDYCVDEFMPYTMMGIDLLLVEYPGYGRSSGRPSQKAIAEISVKAYDWLKDNPSVDSGRLFAHGRSVGGGAACDLARERQLAALILQSTFTDTKQFAKPYVLPPFLVVDKFENLEVVKTYAGPVLVIHGERDEIIPFANAETLAGTAQNGTLVSYSCGHNDCPPDRSQYWRDIAGFLEKNGILSFNQEKRFTEPQKEW